jgi:hypothetical protein
MKSALKTRPKPALALVPKQPAPQIPLDDAEAAALYLVEVMSPAMRAQLGRLLLANAF